MIKRIFSVLLCIAALLSFASCGTKYADNVSVDTLADKVVTALGSATVYVDDKSNLSNDYFKMPDTVTASVVRLAQNSTENLNEFGIYHVTNGKADEFEDVLEDYLEARYEQNASWYQDYIPNEAPKLRDAEVEVFGNYVVYAIFDRNSRDIVFDTVKENLKAN
ncbi:MAG: DUF4358 domain-containing protein [Clostridia bacterium]|nr:DUF4358 domain-containing protein [Clostridia bacterium]